MANLVFDNPGQMIFMYIFVFCEVNLPLRVRHSMGSYVKLYGMSTFDCTLRYECNLTLLIPNNIKINKAWKV
jgi:hypothetical protein